MRAWYSHDGISSLDTIADYFLMTVKPVCRTGFHVCSIYALYGGTHPLWISDNLLTYIGNGLSEGVPEPTMPVGAKKYVYMRP